MSLLLLVPFVFALICVFDIQRAAYAVSVASRSAARAYLLAPSADVASARADQAARVALDDQKIDGRMRLSCVPAGACRQPGSRVRVVIRATVALPLAPSAVSAHLGGIVVDSTHMESFGEFRAGDR
ncbi:MAG: hypothetical protein ACJ71Z_13200 [Aeromicrobium sp.]